MKTGKHGHQGYRVLALACAAALGCTSAFAQDNPTKEETGPTKKLATVTVTGSLIPQAQIETATPTTTITAAQMKANGFSTVADALQQSSFASGSTQGPQDTNSFTPGAQTLSMFGLPVGYVKYLIDGRPMGSFPSLYNGSETFNNLSSIPTEMVDHIDILPGGQSSLYGSDAIAGVVNIILKKKLDAPVIDARYGWTTGGGGVDKRLSFADSLQTGSLNIIAGLQLESTKPIWAYDRPLTSTVVQHGTTPPTASRDYLVYSATAESNGYYMLDPNQCSRVASQYGGTEGLRHRVNSGDFCGSFYSPGYSTLANDTRTAQGYTHATYDVNENMQLYGDFLYSYQQEKFTAGPATNWWGTSPSYGAFYDPNLDDFVNTQRAFAPEEVGGYNSIMSKTIENTYMLTLGAKGGIGSSNWDYDASLTHSDDKLIERSFARFKDPMEAYFAEHVLGPNLGQDPYGNGYDTYAPNYETFYTPISNTDFRSFTGYTDTRSKSWDNLLRAVVTNASLTQMPGGDAGIAFLVEAGNQGWDYSPDPRLLNGDIWGTSSVSGAGHRSRYAATTELRLPLLEQLTMDASVRYDAYNVANATVSKPTYNVALEYRPFDTLLLRAKYGSAFKAPSLSDEFQGESSSYSFAPDYYNCAKLGFSASQVGNCPTKYNNAQFITTQAGNPQLQPISAKVWSYGLVWSPVSRMSVTADILHWSIKNEIEPQDPVKLLQQESLCRLGQLEIQSPTCLAALNQIKRDALGNITSIFTPKVNVANELLDALVVGFNYGFSIGDGGNVALSASYSNTLKHTLQQYAGDPSIDLLRSPLYSTDFKTKANASITWNLNQWSATLYGSRLGSTPNYLSTLTNNYGTPGSGKLAPWMLYNTSVSYNPISNLTLSFLVNNLFNKMPPRDDSYPGYTSGPYNSGNYNVYGRTMYLEATYKFKR
ncbi:TonB-dependent receptor [Dyella jejuensis]|uniref:TonB-dependent receptor n=1 Tax=Dyella jejuensis TaxID=1432009 RepID=A0ABW8JJK0_9GAMM